MPRLPRARRTLRLELDEVRHEVVRWRRDAIRTPELREVAVHVVNFGAATAVLDVLVHAAPVCSRRTHDVLDLVQHRRGL